MIVQMHKNKGVSQDTPFLCNQYDNQTAEIIVNIPFDYVDESYFYYMICKSPNKEVSQFAVPLLLNADKVKFIVGSNVSWTSGDWQFCLLIKSVAIVDGIVGNDGLVAVSKYFSGKVESGIIDESQLAEQPADPNIVIVYDTMIAAVTAENLRVEAENARNVYENYDNTHNYVVGNKVSYEGSSYVNIAPCIGVLPIDINYWLLIAAKGDSGIQGPPGVDGEGAGDMLKSVYDIDGNNIVDDSEKLGGQLPAYYAKSDDVGDKTQLVTDDKTNLVAAVNELKELNNTLVAQLNGITITVKNGFIEFEYEEV